MSDGPGKFDSCLWRAVLWVVGSMVVMVGNSVWHFEDRLLVQCALLASGAVGAWVVLRIPTRKP